MTTGKFPPRLVPPVSEATSTACFCVFSFFCSTWRMDPVLTAAETNNCPSVVVWYEPLSCVTCSGWFSRYLFTGMATMALIAFM